MLNDEYTRTKEEAYEVWKYTLAEYYVRLDEMNRRLCCCSSRRVTYNSQH